MLVRPEDHSRRPVAIRWPSITVLRVFLASSLMIWGVALREVTLLHERVPYVEDGSIAYSIASIRVESWWALPVAAVGAGALMVPWRALKVLVGWPAAAILTASAGLLIGWVVPVQLYREATFFDETSWGNVAVTMIARVAPALVCLAAAVTIIWRTGSRPERWLRQPLAAVAALGALATTLVLGWAVGIEWARRPGGIDTVISLGLLCALALGITATLVVRPPTPTVIRAEVALGAGFIGLAVLVTIPGTATAATCLKSGTLSEWFCGYAEPLLGAAQFLFLTGWVLFARRDPTVDHEPT